MTSLNTWKVLEPDSYYRGFIDKKKRPDGRGWMESRPVMLKVGSINTADGSATVRLGNTTLICGIKAEIAIPDLRKPEEGFLVPNVELYSCCSPAIKAGPPGEKAISTSKFLSDIINAADLIDLKSLCVVPNKVSWCLFCDIVCLDYDGNLLDAALLSLISALENLTLPQVTFNEETEKISVGLEKTQKLHIKNKPTAITFTIYNSEIQLLDPTYEDEREGTGEITMVFQEDGTLCATHKAGGHILSQNIMKNLMEISKKQSFELSQIRKKALLQKKSSMELK